MLVGGGGRGQRRGKGRREGRREGRRRRGDGDGGTVYTDREGEDN